MSEEIFSGHQYWIRVTQCRCLSCGERFSDRSTSYELVKLEEVGGVEERWLPAYGPGGYLDLLPRLVPEFSLSDEIRPKTVKAFDAAFSKHQVLSAAGRAFHVDQGPRCPKCGSKKLERGSEKTLTSPPVEWIRYRGIPGVPDRD